MKQELAHSKWITSNIFESHFTDYLKPGVVVRSRRVALEEPEAWISVSTREQWIASAVSRGGRRKDGLIGRGVINIPGWTKLAERTNQCLMSARKTFGLELYTREWARVWQMQSGSQSCEHNMGSLDCGQGKESGLRGGLLLDSLFSGWEIVTGTRNRDKTWRRKQRQFKNLTFRRRRKRGEVAWGE